MNNYDKMQSRLENLVVATEEMDMVEDDVDAIVNPNNSDDQRTMNSVETVNGIVKEMRDDIYHEFLGDITCWLNEILEKLYNVSVYRSYHNGNGDGYHMNIKSPTVAGANDYEFISRMFWEDITTNCNGFDMIDWPLRINGRSGGWLLLLPNDKLDSLLEIIQDITFRDVTGTVSREDFIDARTFIDRTTMDDVIQELNYFEDVVQQIVDFESYVQDQIDYYEEYVE